MTRARHGLQLHEARRSLVEQWQRQRLGASPAEANAWHRSGLVVNSSPVRRAWLSACERHAKAVAAALVSDSHGALSLGAADIVAMSLLSMFCVIVDEVGTALTAGDDLPVCLNALRPQIEEGMDWLAAGLDRPNRRPPR